MKKAFVFLLSLLLFPTFALAQIQEFSLFTLDIPEGYIYEEVTLTEDKGFAVIIQSEDLKSSATIIYDLLNTLSFQDVLDRYKDVFLPVSVEQNTKVQGEGYILKFVQNSSESVAYIFNENTAYSLFVFSQNDSTIAKVINSIEWK